MLGVNEEKLKRVKCPCCGYYTQLTEIEDEPPFHIFEICNICFWQYDQPMHDKPDISGGANKISLNNARENFKTFGACDEKFKNKVRAPVKEELPENNQ